MKIVQLLSSMRRAGAESVVANLCRGISATGNETHLIVVGSKFDYSEELRNSGVVIHHLRLFYGPIRFYQQVLRRRIKKELIYLLNELRPNILHCHLSYSLIMAAPAADRLKLKTFYTFHGMQYTSNHNNWICEWRNKQFSKAVAQSHCSLLAVSKGTASNAEKGLGLLPNTIAVQPNPIDMEQWRPSINPKNRIAKSVIMVGTLYPLKKVKTGILALKELRHSLDLKLIIAGDGPERGELENLTKSLGLEDRVEFLGVRKDIPALLNVSGAMWLLSEREGMPMAVLEAMASGLPVIATNVPGTNELIVDGVNGLLVPPDSPQVVADVTISLWQDQDLRNRLIDGGLNTVRRFSLDEVVMQHLARYHGDI
jgi:glycosyltransferase involved in cell wall biosynthesis